MFPRLYIRKIHWDCPLKYRYDPKSLNFWIRKSLNFEKSLKLQMFFGKTIPQKLGISNFLKEKKLSGTRKFKEHHR